MQFEVITFNFIEPAEAFSSKVVSANVVGSASRQSTKKGPGGVSTIWAIPGELRCCHQLTGLSARPTSMAFDLDLRQSSEEG